MCIDPPDYHRKKKSPLKRIDLLCVCPAKHAQGTEQDCHNQKGRTARPLTSREYIGLG